MADLVYVNPLVPGDPANKNFVLQSSKVRGIEGQCVNLRILGFTEYFSGYKACRASNLLAKKAGGGEGKSFIGMLVAGI